MFCGNCGNKNPDENKFCSGCGKPINSTTEAENSTPTNTESESIVTQASKPDEKEKVFYKGEGELLIRTTKHHGAGRKVASFVVGAGVGYLIAGRDSKRTSKVKGSLVVTNKAIYCAGNKLSFDRILAMTIKGTLQKKIHLTLDKEEASGGRGKGIGGSSRTSVEVELNTKDLDGLFKGLEQARMGSVEF